MSFPISLSIAPEHSAPLPNEADAVVIGGGVIGVMTAWELAQAGLSVVLLEKGRIAGEQSSRNWGWIRVQGRDLAEVPIALEAQQIWSDLDARLNGALGLKQTGTLYLAGSEAQMQSYQGWLDQVAGMGLSAQLLGAKALRAHIPAARGADWAGALYTPSDCRAEPWRAVPALTRAARAEGVQIRENCAVRLLDLEGGQVAGVITEAGTIKTRRVALAGGAWSALFLRRHGITLPQLSVSSHVAVTQVLPNLHDGGAVQSGLAWRRRYDGAYTLASSGYNRLFVGPDAFRALPHYLAQLKNDPFGVKLHPLAPKGFPDAWGTPRRWQADQISPFERMRILDPKPNLRKLRQTADRFAQIFPDAGQVQLRTCWAGMIDVLPDIVPVVDTCAALLGLTVATGMCGHGFGIGPAFGRITAKLMLGQEPGHDISRFRLPRFSDGSKLELGPDI